MNAKMYNTILHFTGVTHPTQDRNKNHSFVVIVYKSGKVSYFSHDLNKRLAEEGSNIIMLNEISQRNTYIMISLMCGL